VRPLSLSRTAARAEPRPTGADEGLRLGRHPGVAAPVNKRGAKENTACRQTCEAAYRATRRAQVQRITRKWSMDQGQQTDR
jgi:hypothetical protein